MIEKCPCLGLGELHEGQCSRSAASQEFYFLPAGVKAPLLAPGKCRKQLRLIRAISYLFRVLIVWVLSSRREKNPKYSPAQPHHLVWKNYQRAGQVFRRVDAFFFPFLPLSCLFLALFLLFFAPFLPLLAPFFPFFLIFSLAPFSHLSSPFPPSPLPLSYLLFLSSKSITQFLPSNPSFPLPQSFIFPSLIFPASLSFLPKTPKWQQMLFFFVLS